MAKRRLTSRQKRQRTKKIRNRVILALAVLALTSAAMAPELRAYLNAKIRRGVQAFADLRAQEIEVTLPERRIYALQLGVFDNGESAESERKRLAAMGVPCVVWQDAQMRLMADAATSRETLLGETAGQTSFVTEETLTRVDMRLSAGKSDGNDAARLLHLPDEALSRLESGETLADVLADVRAQAQRGVSAHPENTLYTQLAQSLVNWCALIEKTPNGDKPYARATMALLCRELQTGAGQSVGVEHRLRASYAVHGGGGDAARVARALAAGIQPEHADALEGFVAGDAHGRGGARFRPGEHCVRAGQTRAGGDPAAEAPRAWRR